MERRVPKSNKYDHVTATLDTGVTVNKVKHVTAREYAKRRDEIFFRITRHQLYELYSEYEQDEYETISETHAVDSKPRVVTYHEEDKPVYTKPYLILDMRDTNDYNTCHLLQARSFPDTLLRRDQYHPEIYRFRNKEEHLIILYCNDEKISQEAAAVMVTRGIDNIYLLSGGLAQFAADYSAFVEGEVPRELVPVSTPSKATGRRLGAIPEDQVYSRGGDGGISARGSSGPRSPESKLTFNKLQQHNSRTSTGGRVSAGGLTSRQTQRDMKSDAGTARSNMSGGLYYYVAI
ncbi:rhodanese-like domain-containing protein [archaeon]|nr:MAG: rhodanese-like domain-containing protein [archaeon]